MNAIILLDAHGGSLNTGYLFGAIISVLLAGYLIYSLIKPEKF